MVQSTEIPSAKAIPETLLEHDQWLCWRAEDRDGKVTKVPVDPTTGHIASATDPETWTSFERARAGVDAFDVTGMGFAFHDEGSIVGVDLDDCRDGSSGELVEWAEDVIDTLNSYTEISPSGEGVHVLVTGSLPPGRNRRGDVEIYDADRFFTVTGRHVEGTPTSVTERSGSLRDVYNAFVHTVDDGDAESTGSDEREHAGRVDATSDDPSNGATTDAARISDEELLSRARNAANGAKFDRLWRGDTSGYESHSEADMALCALLAFWTGGDQARVDDLFRRSGLFREKWDEIHYADGRTYGAVTVQRAVDGTDEVYEPSPESNFEISERHDTHRVRATSDAGDGHGQHREDVEEVTRLREQVAHLTRELRKRDDEVAQLREALRERENEAPSGCTRSSARQRSFVERVEGHLVRLLRN